jgi:hypothetical protein
MKKNAVFAIFFNEAQVEHALKDLRGAGFLPSEVSLLTPDHPGDQSFSSDQVTRIALGAEVGGGLGLFMGASAGLLAGLEAMWLPFMDGIHIHPVVGAFVGAVCGGLFGAGSGALVGIGTPGAPSDRYARYLEDGGILLSVHTENKERCETATKILEICGGSDLAVVNEIDGWNGVLARSRSFRERVNGFKKKYMAYETGESTATT